MAHTRETMLIIGASRGIGAAVAAHLAKRDVELLTVSRSPASVGTWIEADMATSDGIARVIDAVGQRPLDALLYLGGVWEEGALPTPMISVPAAMRRPGSCWASISSRRSN